MADPGETAGDLAPGAIASRLRREVRATRQHHALEHATLQVLAARGQLSLGGGVSDPRGFTLFGDMNLADTRVAAQAALEALQDGHEDLAIHPNCGTNLMMQSMLCLAAGLFRPVRRRLTPFRLILLLPLFMIAIAGGQLLGLRAQAYTTLADVADRRLRQVYAVSVLGRRCLRVEFGPDA